MFSDLKIVQSKLCYKIEEKIFKVNDTFKEATNFQVFHSGRRTSQHC